MTYSELVNPAPVTTKTAYLLDIGLQAVEDSMRQVVSSDIPILHEASNHILDAGGKRVRPRLTLLAYIAAGGSDMAHIAPVAAAVELMHTASVVHDDINDHGVMRRGRPSINAKWGRTFALLTGDFLFTAVYQLMAPYGNLNQILADAATALVEGETLQAYAVKHNEFTRENYTRIIALKTAALFRAGGELGARLADAPREVVRALADYAYNVGLAFQITDDILDILGDEATLGKTAGIDLAQGRGVVAVEDADTPQRGDPLETIKQKLLSGNRLQEAHQHAEALAALAANQLNVLPSSDAKDELIALSDQVINRQT